MQRGSGEHDSMRGFNGYMMPSQGIPYNMQQQQQQQHGQGRL